MKTIPEPVLIAFAHVKAFYPQVSRAVFSTDGRWQFTDDDFDSPTFGPELDVAPLEDAADWLDANGLLPAVFELSQD